MPFPTVDGRSFMELATPLLELVTPSARPDLLAAFQAVDAVSTQLYYDVQKLKRLAHEHGWEIETDDPSQAPIS
jgi:hypothetical protein